jgi:hypothetical protein
MKRALTSAVVERIRGGKPSAPRAIFAAAIVGAAAACLTYKALRG